MNFDYSIIDNIADKHHIKKVFNSFKEGEKNELNKDDSLFVVFIGNGGDKHFVLDYYLKKWFNKEYPEEIFGNNDTFFPLEPMNNFVFKHVLKYDLILYAMLFPNYPLWEYQFARCARGINARTIFALQPCKSGGFINALSGENRIVCTASREDELANAAWIGPFRYALNEIDECNNINGEPIPDGIPDADICPQDGNISILEAYRYAAEKVEDQVVQNNNLKPQHPLIDDNGDKIGHYYTETGYDPNTLGMDGCLAAGFIPK